MFCGNCGNDVDVTDKFCAKCGTPIDRNRTIGVVKMKCQECNGSMEFGEDEQILECPYCGSVKLILESDRVRNERIQSMAYKASEIEWEQERTKKQTERINRIGKMIIRNLLIRFGVGIFGIILFVVFFFIV